MDLRCILVLRSSELSREDNSMKKSFPTPYMHYSKTIDLHRGRPLDQTVQIEEGEDTGWSEPERVVLKLRYLSKTEEKKKSNIITASSHFIVVVTQKVVKFSPIKSLRYTESHELKGESPPPTPLPHLPFSLLLHPSLMPFPLPLPSALICLQ